MIKRPVTDRTPDGDIRPRLEVYRRLPASRWPGLLRWSLRGLLGVFALIGAIAIVREGFKVFVGAPAASRDASSAVATAVQTPAAADQPVPTNVSGPIIVAPSEEEAEAKAAADGTPDFAAEKAQAEEQLKARIPEIDGLRYRDVKTNVTTADGQSMVDFCGEVNSLGPSGTYVGFQKFIASRQDARVELDAAPGEFTQAWDKRCQGTEGPKIWN